MEIWLDVTIAGQTNDEPEKGRVPEKSCCTFGFFPNEGEGGEEGHAQIFCHLLISAFLINERSLFPPKCHKLNFKLFFRLYT